MPNTPNINIVTGALDGTLAKGQTFYWYNPNANDVADHHSKLRHMVRKFPAQSPAGPALRGGPNSWHPEPE